MTPTRTKVSAVGAATTLVGGAGSVLLLSLAATPAGAATTWTVDTLDDVGETAADCTPPTSGSCSLRDALAAASPDDTIVFAPSLFTGGAGTIILTDGQLSDVDVDIVGPGRNLLTIDAGGTSRAIEVTGTAASTTISGLTVTHGAATGLDGGGILAAVNLTLRDVTVSSSSSHNGGGVAVVGDFVLADSSIVSNTASGSNGGAVATGVTTVTRSTISGNHAREVAGLDAYGAVTITGSTISDNVSTTGGGGLAALSSVSIVDSTFSGNTAVACGGAIYFGGSSTTLSVLGSTFTGNVAANCLGGAIDLYGTGNSVLIANSTFTGNSAVTGAALNINVDNQVEIAMTTITGNISTNTNQPAFYTGGGIHLNAGRTTPSVTTTATVRMSGVILAGNIAPAGGTADFAIGARDFPGAGTLVAADSMIGSLTANVTLDGTGVVRGTDPKLGPLAANGGPTLTMLPLAGSPVLDAGPATMVSFPGNTYDQRGVGFLRISGKTSDIGAVEVQVPPEPVVPHFTG